MKIISNQQKIAELIIHNHINYLAINSLKFLHSRLLILNDIICKNLGAKIIKEASSKAYLFGDLYIKAHIKSKDKQRYFVRIKCPQWVNGYLTCLKSYSPAF